MAAGNVMAQSAVGSVFGDAKAGAEVTIENLGSGASRSVSADKQGRYSLNQLPPGNYRVTSDGVSRSIHVPVGTGIEVDFVAKGGDAKTLDAVTVSGGRVNPIDVSSVESTTIFTAQELQKLPVEREIGSVALLAPGVVAGDEEYGKLVAIGGASVAENGYYVNGFDITNPRSMMTYFDIPYEAVGEAQIKTGGYGAEYGRSLGGVLGQVLKRGTNEWHYGAAAYYTPDRFRERQIVNKSVRESDFADGRVQTSNKDDVSDYLKYNVFASGPIIKDRLFFFALLQGKRDQVESYGNTTSGIYRDKTPQQVVKLDWNITDNHLLEFTGINAELNLTKDQYKRELDANDKPINPYTKKNLVFADHNEYTGGGRMGALRYTGWFGDNFTLSGQVGRLEYTNGAYRKQASSSDCPVVVETGLGGTEMYQEIGCSTDWWFKPVGTPEQDIRTSFRIDGGWRIGDHDIKFGWDEERIQSNTIEYHASGEAWYNYFEPDGNGEMVDYLYSYATFGGFGGSGGNLVQKVVDDEGGGTFESKNAAIYLDDNWHVTDNFLLYGGLRRESFDNRDQHGNVYIRANAQWSPRLGFSWDVNGDSSFKLYGTLGRYYIPAPGLLAITKSGYNQYTVSFHNYTGRDPATGAPTGLSGPLSYDVSNLQGWPAYDPNTTDATAWWFSTRPKEDARTAVANNLRPMGQDELILGAQWTVGKDWTLGLKGILRNLIDGVDNYCLVQSRYAPLVEWMHANGYPDYTDQDAFDRRQAGCVYVNPGRDPEIAIKLDDKVDGEVVYATLPNKTLGMGTGLQDYKRRYNSLQLSLEKWTSTWYLHADYVWSNNYGNAEGYANSSYRDAGRWVGQSINFNHPIVDVGAYGDLPGDRTHSFKVYGNMQLGEQFQLGGNFVLQSGRPLSCLGASPYQRDDRRNGKTPDGKVYVGTLPSDVNAMRAYSANATHYCHDKPYDTTFTDSSGYKWSYTSFAPTLHSVGGEGRTPWYWNFDFSAAYIPTWADKKLTFRMNVYNLFNRHGVLTRYESHDATLTVKDAAQLGYAQTLTRPNGTVVTAENATADELAKLQSYGGGGVFGPNPNYGKLPTYQSPRYVQFSVRYEF